MPARLPALTSVSAAAFTTSALRSFADDHRLPTSTSSHHIGADAAPARFAASSAPCTLLAAPLYAWQGRSVMAHAPAGPAMAAGEPTSTEARLTYRAPPLPLWTAQ